MKQEVLESAYAQCLAYQLRLRGRHIQEQRPRPVHYKGIALDCGYRLDLVVEDRVVVELKAVERLLPVQRR